MADESTKLSDFYKRFSELQDEADKHGITSMFVVAVVDHFDHTEEKGGRHVGGGSIVALGMCAWYQEKVKREYIT